MIELFKMLNGKKTRQEDIEDKTLMQLQMCLGRFDKCSHVRFSMHLRR